MDGTLKNSDAVIE